MSNQLQITGAAKVRGLEGVLTGTSGVVGALGINVANGIPKLDSNGKILVSQLPSSVMEYKGTWNAATNTPTLANGTGDVGDVYLCNVAGTTNFGAGPITFAVGDQVIYSGTIWQKASGATGTVTSVAMTVPSGLTVTGSPITTSGTLAVSLASGYTIPTTSFLSGLVPYTGATQTVDLGSYDLNARGIKINGTGGLGHADFKHQSGTPTGSASSSTLYADTNGNIAWLNDHSNTITLAANANTADRTYTFPNASGTIALTSDISYPVTSVFGRTGAVTAQSGDYTTTQVTEGTNLYYTDARARGALSFTAGSGAYNSTTGVITIPTNTNQLTNGANYITLTSLSAGTGISYNSTTGVISSTITQYTDANARAAISLTTTGATGAATYNSTTGVLNIPNYSAAGYVPYSGATSSLNLGVYSTTTFGVNIYGDPTAGTGGAVNIRKYSSAWSLGTGDNLSLYATTGNQLIVQTGGKNANLDFNSISTTSPRTYTFPDATGTIALTSNLSAYLTLTGGTLTGTLNGTSAIFSSSISATSGTLTGGLTLNDSSFITFKNNGTSPSTVTGSTSVYWILNGSYTQNQIRKTDGQIISLQYPNDSLSHQYTFPTTDGTIALTSQIPSLSGYVQGSGTTNYHAKFTAGSTIGNSMLTDDGTTLQSIGATRSNLYLRAASSSYYSQLAFTNGTNGSFGGLSYNNASQYMQFEVNSSEYMRLYGNGNLRLFSSSATDSGYKLQVEGTGTFSGNVGIGGGANERLTITGPSGLAGMVRWTDATTGSAFLGFTSGGVAYIHSNNNSLAFGANGSNNFSETMRITGGNVGIGTTSPSRPLTIVGSGGSQIRISDGTSGTYWDFYSVYANSNQDLYIRNQSFNAIIISSYGKVGIGVTTPSSYLEVNGDMVSVGSGSSVSWQDRSGSGRFSWYAPNGNFTYLYNLGNIGQFSMSTGVYTPLSDVNKKKDFEESTIGLDAILGLKPTLYRMKNADENSEKELGFIAQQVKEFIPQAYMEDGEGEDKFIGLSDRPIIAALVKAVQELKAEIDELKNK